MAWKETDRRAKREMTIERDEPIFSFRNECNEKLQV
jgi:hypothetical protein